MTDYIALLRGVNVGGITVRSAELKPVFESLGFTGVRTVLASGNVVFTDEGRPAAIKRTIEAALEERFGYDAWIVLVDRERLVQVIDGFPFDATREGWHPYVLFASDESALDDIESSAGDLDAADDVIARGGDVLYWHNRRDVGISSPFAKLVAKARFRTVTTNRNLRTLQKLL
jgi:uncharacterized protein (DUF1697 family)